MKQLRFLTIIIILLSFSCQKESSIDFDIVGQWIEKGIKGGCTIEFTDNGSAIVNLYSNNNIQEYTYRIDEDANKIFFAMPDNPDSGWWHKYSYDETSKELTIWSLYMANLENPSKTVLTKVTL
jgi:hypothetical protein